MNFMKNLQHLKIQLEDIERATDSFGAKNIIGKGGFGKVYKGVLSHFKGQNVVAIKRLDRNTGQGDTEFLKEIMMLSRYTHENLVTLLGFCNDGHEEILVYEYAAHGSLDRHLNSTILTWSQRLKICLAAAKGLSHLHDPNGTHQRVLHCDIKSANILLDENWIAKVSDFGLSKMGPANQPNTFIVTNAMGTIGYIDPLFLETYTLTKESDVYSFGVVLFEVLCGRLCFAYRNGRFEVFVRMWKQRYEEKNLDDIIFESLKQQMDPNSLESFSVIAYQCLQKSHQDRPTMAHVVRELEIALEFQENYEALKLPAGYEEIIKTTIHPLIYRSIEELKTLLSKGILINGGQTWFSLNDKGEHCETISASECLIPDTTRGDNYVYSLEYNSRFPMGSYQSSLKKFKTYIRAQFLSPLITYKMNLLFKFIPKKDAYSEPTCIALKYRLEGDTKYSTSYIVLERKYQWLMAELYHFTNGGRTSNLKIQFEIADDNLQSLVVEGIEFQPLEEVEDEVLEDEDMKLISDSDIDWDQILPNDYEDVIKWSKDIVQWTSKKELFSLLREGFLINDGEEWFSIAKNGKKCYMVPARAVFESHEWSWQTVAESRFQEVASCQYRTFSIICNIKSQILSPHTRYVGYLVYKLPESHSRFEGLLKVMDKDLHFNILEETFTRFVTFVYLVTPQIPVIRHKLLQNTHTPLNRPNVKGLPRLRKDGWMEVQVWESQTSNPAEVWESQSSNRTDMISMRIVLSDMPDRNIYGLLVQGIEFKPL